MRTELLLTKEQQEAIDSLDKIIQDEIDRTYAILSKRQSFPTYEEAMQIQNELHRKIDPLIEKKADLISRIPVRFML